MRQSKKETDEGTSSSMALNGKSQTAEQSEKYGDDEESSVGENEELNEDELEEKEFEDKEER